MRSLFRPALCASPEGDGQEMEVEAINLAGAVNSLLKPTDQR
jgi:hypothetical protein